MNNKKSIAVLFDFDGVIMDTEPQYTLFWDAQGKKYHPEIADFGKCIKGQTLTQIYSQYFLQPEGIQSQITSELLDFETKMYFEYIPGVVDFIQELRDKGVKIAIVTSSNDQKMDNAYRAHPELKMMMDTIVTADKVTHSKPHPECFLLGAEILGMSIEDCVVFEDSFHGIEAGTRAGMKVIGLATTNPASAIEDKANLVISDFVDFSYEKMMSVLD